MEFVSDLDGLYANALTLADAIHDGDLDTAGAAELVARGRVFLPFPYGDKLVFAPAKFIGYRQNSVEEYKRTTRIRTGSKARSEITKVLKLKATENPTFEHQLNNYCEQLGVELRNNKHSFWATRSASKWLAKDRSAIHDIDAGDVGNPDPEYRTRMAGSYVRVQSVRREVLERAGGRCEFCGQPGFLDRRGKRFLESHHIISLSKQGPDTTDNVIALCPNDHRRAHFGDDWQSLQTKFEAILKELPR